MFFRKSHQPSGLRWFRALHWSHPLPLFPRGGVYPSPYPALKRPPSGRVCRLVLSFLNFNFS